jgi:hypothetical protein
LLAYPFGVCGGDGLGQLSPSHPVNAHQLLGSLERALSGMLAAVFCFAEKAFACYGAGSLVFAVMMLGLHNENGCLEVAMSL